MANLKSGNTFVEGTRLRSRTESLNHTSHSSTISNVRALFSKDKSSVENVIPQLHLGGLSRSPQVLASMYDQSRIGNANALKFLASEESTAKYKWSKLKISTRNANDVNFLVGEDRYDKGGIEVIKASTNVQATIDEVISMLLHENTARLNAAQQEIDPTFLGGEVLSTVYPYPNKEAYTFPSVPLCTIKRTCHNLDPKRSPRDFVYLDCCQFDRDNHTGERIGIKTMTSIELNEIPEKPRGSSCTRGFYLEGSGIVARDTKAGNTEIICVLVVELGTTSKLREAAGVFLNKRKSISRMAYWLEQIRFQVDEAVSIYGSWKAFKGINKIRVIDSSEAKSLSNTSEKVKAKMGTIQWKDEMSISDFKDDKDDELDKESKADSRDTLAYELAQIENSAKDGMRRSSEISAASKTGFTFAKDDAENQANEKNLENNTEYSIVQSNSESQSQQPEALSNSNVNYDTLQGHSDIYEDVQNVMAELLHRTEARVRLLEEEEMSMLETQHIQKLKAEKEKLLAELETFKTVEAEKAALKNELSKLQEKLQNYESATLQKTNSSQQELSRTRQFGNDSELLKKYNAMLAKYEAIKSMIPGAQDIDCIDGTLEDAETKLREFALRIQENPNDIEAENMIERLDNFIKNHPEYKMRKSREREQWESQNYCLNKQALVDMQRIVPEKVLAMNEQNKKKYYSDKPALAKRVHKFREVFQMYYTSQNDIAKKHIAAFIAMDIGKLDIIELRAVYACLPKVFVADNGNKKALWREEATEKLMYMTKLENEGKLTQSQKRHSAYLKNSNCKQALSKKSIKPNQNPSNKMKSLASELQMKLEVKAAQPKVRHMPFLEELQSKRNANIKASKKQDLRKKEKPGFKRPEFLQELQSRANAGASGGKDNGKNQRPNLTHPEFLQELQASHKKNPGNNTNIKQKTDVQKAEKGNSKEQIHKSYPRDRCKPSFLREIELRNKEHSACGSSGTGEFDKTNVEQTLSNGSLDVEPLPLAPKVDGICSQNYRLDSTKKDKSAYAMSKSAPLKQDNSQTQSDIPSSDSNGAQERLRTTDMDSLESKLQIIRKLKMNQLRINDKEEKAEDIKRQGGDHLSNNEVKKTLIVKDTDSATLEENKGKMSKVERVDSIKELTTRLLKEQKARQSK